MIRLCLLVTSLSLLAAVNEMAQNFTLKDSKGKAVSLSDFKGKTVVLEWFNDGCPFVKKHYTKSGYMPGLQEKYSGQVVWLTINSSAPGKQGDLTPSGRAEEIRKSYSLKSKHLLVDSSGAVGKMYDAKVTPHMFIINKEGKLVYDGAIDGEPSTDEDDILEADKLFEEGLKAALMGKAVPKAKNKPYGCSVKYKS